MKRKFLRGFLVAAMALTLTSGTVYGKELVNSVPSVAEDHSVGQDTTQDKKTEYADPLTITTTTHTSDHPVAVYATKTSNVVVGIPKTVILGETTENGVFIGGYTAEVIGDIAGTQVVTLTPEVTTNVKEAGGKNSDAVHTSVTIGGGSSMVVGANDLLNGAKVTKEGEIRATGLTAGVWNGGVTFHVTVSNN